MSSTIDDCGLLAIDVGNTRVKLGWFSPELLSESTHTSLPEPAAVLAISNSELSNLADNTAIWNELRSWAERCGSSPRLTILCSVNPMVCRTLIMAWRNVGWPAPRVLEQAALLPMHVDLPNPDHSGMDRLLNGVVAAAIRKPGHPAIIVSAGTATVIDYISADGVFVGGAILPGLEMSAMSLFRFTALLPLIPVGDLSEHPPPPLGKDTTASMRAGILFSQVGAIRELIVRYQSMHANPAEVILTGGSAAALQRYLPPGCRLEQDLPLRGLLLTVRGLPWRDLAESAASLAGV